MSTARNGAEFLAIMRGRLAALAEAAQVLAGEIESRAPRRTGRLARSIRPTKVRKAGLRISASVEVVAPYVAAEEFGTEHQAADPFIRPGAEAARRPVRQVLSRVAKSL